MKTPKSTPKNLCLEVPGLELLKPLLTEIQKLLHPQSTRLLLSLFPSFEPASSESPPQQLPRCLPYLSAQWPKKSDQGMEEAGMGESIPSHFGLCSSFLVSCCQSQPGVHATWEPRRAGLSRLTAYQVLLKAPHTETSKNCIITQRTSLYSSGTWTVLPHAKTREGEHCWLMTLT